MPSLPVAELDDGTAAELRAVLDGAQWAAPWIDNYSVGQLPRLCWTAAFLRERCQARTVLEIGAAPYCLSLLLAHCFERVDVTRLGSGSFGLRSFRLGSFGLGSFRLGSFGLGSFVGDGGTVRIDTEKGEVSFRSMVFDAESQPCPAAAGSYDLVVCCEIIEHLTRDPMYMLLEARRVLVERGWLVVTTPNAVAYRALEWMLNLRPANADPFYRKSPSNRHNRELSQAQLDVLVRSAGFDIVDSGTVTFKPREVEHPWLLERLAQTEGLDGRGDYLYCLGRRSDHEVVRYPEELLLYRASDFIESSPLP